MLSAHGDRNPSLHITLAADWLLKCMAGCETADVLAAARLDWSDLFAARNNGRREVETYPYTDEQSGPLFEVVRYWPKDFRQRRRTEPGT